MSRISSTMLNRQIVNDIVRQQQNISRVQTEIASGRKINSPKDDPAQAARLLGLEEASARLTQFERNSNAAESRLTLAETSLTGVNNLLLRVRDLALSATSGAIDDHARTAIRTELTQRLDELYDVANVRDSNGDYLFSGSKNQTIPFSQGVPPTYGGDDSTSRIPIGLGENIQISDAGSDIFLRIRSGNGNFTTDSDATNTGTGIISTGSVSDISNFDSVPFEIRFTSANNFDVVDMNSGLTIQSSVNYVENSSINFNGSELSIRGEPAAGDVFTIQPAQFTDVFSTLAGFISTMSDPVTNDADQSRQVQQVNSAIINLDQSLEHINATRSGIGSRLNSIDSRRDENSAAQLQIARTEASIEDLDIAEAVTELETRISSLEILQKSYARVENLSLFNYL